MKLKKHYLTFVKEKKKKIPHVASYFCHCQRKGLLYFGSEKKLLDGRGRGPYRG